MDLIGEERGRLTRAAQWLSATRAELVGLAILLAGCVALTATLWFSGTSDPLSAEGGPAAAVGGAVEADDRDATHDGGDWDDGEAWDEGEEGWDDPEEAGGTDGVAGGPQDATVEAVVVHVSGAVAEPGLLSLEAGARVGDAIEAAGGPVDDAEMERVNLARTLTDGERVHVPRAGEELPAETVAGGAGAGGSGADVPIDLNRAGVEQLETLPGIGPARAQAIVDHRETHGPFEEPGDLRAVSGIGEATFQRLAERVTVS